MFRRSRSFPRAIAFLLLAAQAVTGGCALRGTGGAPPTKHDTLQVQFDPYTAIASEGGVYEVRSIVGEAWSVSVDSLRLRVREATSPDASEIAELSGQVVTVGRDRVGSILVLDRDRSGEFMAGAFVVLVAAGLAGFLWLLSHWAEA